MSSFPHIFIGPVWVTTHALTRGIVRYARVEQIGPHTIVAASLFAPAPSSAPSSIESTPVRIRKGWFLSYTDALAEARAQAEARQAQIAPRIAAVSRQGESQASRHSMIVAEWRALTKIVQNTVVVWDGDTGEMIPCA